MGFAPVPTEKCAAWLRRSVLTIGLNLKSERLGAPAREGLVPLDLILSSYPKTSTVA
jgi:hypothetical protein